MTMLDRNHHEQVAALFKRFGAEDAQANVMAKQLLRRSVQIAEERNISELEALEALLKQVIDARQGS
jgi:hypothetical protein